MVFDWFYNRLDCKKMKKQLLAAAITSSIMAPIAVNADATIYGQLHYSIDSIDYGSGYGIAIQGTGMDALNNGFDGLGVNSHNSRFGIKGSEDLGEGLSLVYQMEFTISGDDLTTVSNNRNTYLALAGSWGVAGIGQVDTPYKSSTASLELFSEQVGDYNQLWFDDIRTTDAVFYMSPNWNGFSFVAAVVLPSGDNNADGIEATSISATYENGPFFATMAYEDISDDYVNVLHSAVIDYDKWRIGLGYTANGFHVGYIYEDRDFETLGDGESWQLSGSYTMGNNTFKAAYGQTDDWARRTGAVGVIDDGEQWSIGLDHKLSNRTTLYVTYADFESDNTGGDAKYDALSFGVIHNF